MNYQPRGINDQAIQGPASYLSELGAAEALLKTQPTWNGVTAEAVARMRLQNRFKTGLDIARYTAAPMRSDMAAYDADPSLMNPTLRSAAAAGIRVILLNAGCDNADNAVSGAITCVGSPRRSPASPPASSSRSSARPRCCA